ncbi:MAG: transferrin-binding protein-like solute binding protein [Candidatus Andeanibacterium colombiense]|uniref:Transferrin-binding protein-like solute binding protein n=1 Tax=Candidatus Andeanibacterium colombiense TaxID=3121345 RepID=A0AAJ5XA40_9SPHN|nr:MAG: transferrin-binding protein-like solute binding protein [Sphingomonadaceae bacterium]
MKTGRRFVAGASLLPLALMLAACGGGGVSSTPTPGTPTPTPGTPTPTPGTPTPTPGTPTPTPSSSSLVNPTTAANYANKAVTLKAVVGESGGVKSGATHQAGSLTFNYNPSTQAYTVTRSGSARSFGPSEFLGYDTAVKVPLAEYARSIDDGYENLVISTMPNTAEGRLNWVGQGQFVRRKVNGSEYSLDTDAFYFGIPTASGHVPLTGSATYAVYVLGVVTQPGGYPLLLESDPGELAANFATGKITVAGNAQSYTISNHDQSSYFNYSGTATISSNGFSGSFLLGGASGTWSGEFFGPDAQEVGAVAHGGNSETTYALSLIGSSDLDFRGFETDLLHLSNVTEWGGFGLDDIQVMDAATNTIKNESGYAIVSGGIRYDPNRETWTYGGAFRHDQTDFDSSQSNSTWAIYGDVTPDANGTNGLTLLIPGSGNPKIQLTYTSLAIFEYGQPNGVYDWEINRHWLVFGFKTDPADVPVSGSASYSGLVYGVAQSTGGANNQFYTLGGAVNLSANFGTGKWNGSLSPTGTERSGGASRSFATFSFANGTISGNDLQSTDLTYGGSRVGDVFGGFFGPKAAEFGGGFNASMTDPARAGYDLNMNGLFLGKKN